MGWTSHGTKCAPWSKNGRCVRNKVCVAAGAFREGREALVPGRAIFEVPSESHSWVCRAGQLVCCVGGKCSVLLLSDND